MSHLGVGVSNSAISNSHLPLDEALKLIAEIKPAQAYLTHVSHQMGTYQEIMKMLPAPVNLAYD